MAWSVDVDHAKVLLNILSLMNSYKYIIATNDQLALNLLDICLNNTLKIECESLLCFALIWKIDTKNRM